MYYRPIVHYHPRNSFMLTVADLLKRVNLQHRISQEHPFLEMPLAIFQESEYPELITLLWLFDQNWFVPLKLSVAKCKLGGVSQKQAESFYNALHNEAAKLCKQLPRTELWSFQAKPESGWLSPMHMTHYLWHSNEVFTKLRRFAGKSSPLTLLSNQYTTIDEILQNIPMALLPTSSCPTLKYLLQLNLKKIGLLTEQELMEITCYLLLFIANHATVESPIMNCTYPIATIKEAMHEQIQKSALDLQRYLTHQEEFPSHHFDLDLINRLGIQQMSLPTHLVGLIALECSPKLRSLVVLSKKKLGTNIQKLLTPPCYALLPTKNPFLYGFIAHSATKSYIPVSNQDVFTLSDLCALSVKAQAANTPFFSPTGSVASNYQRDFEQQKALIIDDALKQSLTYQSVANITFLPTLNINAIAEFLVNYGISSSSPRLVPEADLTKLLSLFAENKEYIMVRLKKYPQLISLDEDDLVDEIKKVEHYIRKLEQQKEKEQGPLKSKFAWLQLQSDLWQYFHGLLVTKQEQLEDDEEAVMNLSLS